MARRARYVLAKSSTPDVSRSSRCSRQGRCSPRAVCRRRTASHTVPSGCLYVGCVTSPAGLFTASTASSSKSTGGIGGTAPSTSRSTEGLLATLATAISLRGALSSQHYAHEKYSARRLAGGTAPQSVAFGNCSADVCADVVC